VEYLNDRERGRDEQEMAEMNPETKPYLLVRNARKEGQWEGGEKDLKKKNGAIKTTERGVWRVSTY